MRYIRNSSQLMVPGGLLTLIGEAPLAWMLSLTPDTKPSWGGVELFTDIGEIFGAILGVGVVLF